MKRLLKIMANTTTRRACRDLGSLAMGWSTEGRKDTHTYLTGIKATDDELKSLHLSRAAFHGE
jgi:hypothetical protein